MSKVIKIKSNNQTKVVTLAKSYPITVAESVVVTNPDGTTELLSDKVFDYVEKPNTVNAGDGNITIANLKGNTDYICGVITTLTITAVETSSLTSSVKFTTGNTISINLPNDLNWVDGEKPTTADTNTQYILTICNGIGILTNLGAAA